MLPPRLIICSLCLSICTVHNYLTAPLSSEDKIHGIVDFSYRRFSCFGTIASRTKCTNMYFENVELWNFDLTAPSTASREDIFRRRVILWMQITRTANHFLSRDTSKMQGNPLFSFVSFVHFRLSVLGDHWQPNIIWLAIIGQVNSYHFHYMAQVFFLEVCPYSSTASFVSVVRVAGKKAKKDF